MPGDCVRRLIQGEDSQRGYVQDMTVECCLQVMGTRKFIDAIHSKDLLQIRVSIFLSLGKVIGVISFWLSNCKIQGPFLLSTFYLTAMLYTLLSTF